MIMELLVVWVVVLVKDEDCDLDFCVLDCVFWTIHIHIGFRIESRFRTVELEISPTPWYSQCYFDTYIAK